MNKNIISHHGIHINFQFLDIQQQMKGQNYRFDDLQKVWVQLTNTKGANAYVFKQQLNLISRIIIWDDQNQTDFFGSICQLKVFEVLIEIFSKSKDKDVINAIIGFFTTMLTNLARQPSINYLLSHSSIISLQLTKFGNMGNEIADYYINFLKVLSRKITLNNLNLFYNKRYPNFPILNQATRFFNHPQNLVRTTSRNIILTIAKLKSQAIHKYMSGFPFVSYFIHECNFIREYWLIIDNILHTEEENRYELDNIDTLIQDHEEIIIFLDDLMGLNQRGVPEKFIDAFINESLSPLVIALDSEHKQGFSIKITLYLLAILFKTFNHTFILDTLALIFFGKYYPKDLLLCLFQPIDRLLSYDKKWKFKGFWDSHDDKIVQYSSETYHFDGKKKIINEPTLMENISKRIDTFSVFGVTNNFYQRQIEKVNLDFIKIENTFNIPIISPADKITRKSGSTVIKEMIDQITSQKGVNLNDYEMNPICDTIFSYITSKDDSLVILTLNILSIFFQNSSISEKIKRHCKMSLQSEINDFQSVMRIEKLIIQCVKIFQVDPPCYRICTYMEAQELVKRIIVFYKKSSLPISKDIVISLKHSLKIALDRINPYLYGGKQWEKTLQIYHEVQKNYTKRRSKTLKTFGLIPNDQSNESEVTFTNMVYQEYPKDFCQQITRDFWIFLLIKDLFLYVNQEYSIYKIQLPKNENTGYKYQMGKMYKAVDQQKIEAQFRTSVMQNYSFCELILMSGYFAILRNNRIQVRANYEQLIVMSDKSDPRKILLNLQEGNVWIGLKEAKVALQLKKHFQESKSVMLRYRLTQKIKENEILSALL